MHLSLIARFDAFNNQLTAINGATLPESATHPATFQSAQTRRCAMQAHTDHHCNSGESSAGLGSPPPSEACPFAEECKQTKVSWATSAFACIQFWKYRLRLVNTVQFDWKRTSRSSSREEANALLLKHHEARRSRLRVALSLSSLPRHA